MATTKLFFACLFVFSIGQYGTPTASAQSGGNRSIYTQSFIDNLNGRNTSSAFSGQRYQSRVFSRAVPRQSYSKANRDLFRGITNNSSRPKKKPFSSVNRGPTVTPYLGLGGLPSGGAPNYYTNVKPQLAQQRVNRQSQRQNTALQRQLNQVTAQPPFNPKGSETMAPTGHTAVFMNYGGYYPQKP